MQLGFVIDHGRCIGCHACTVACKSENDVPLGDFRTWVKYTEVGKFPDVKRSFAVLRCNQCTNAPCVAICPVNALSKRSKDGIVDVDPTLCIGCKGCMQACPYDALYINDAKGTAEKCHFCAHRTEIGLAPACAVVCPTEAIIPGDFHDPTSVVSTMKAAGGLTARKLEAGTAPNVWYREASPHGLDPLTTNTAGGYLWSNQLPGPQLDAQTYEALEHKAEARTVYDVPHAPLWGGMVTAYLFAKSLAAGAFLAPLLAWLAGGPGSPFDPLTLVLAIGFLLLTTALLVGDLKRPERFYYILTNPNWGSWIAKGAIVLTAYGCLLGLGLLLSLAGVSLPSAVSIGLIVLTAVAAILTASYTAWLFGQAKGRVLWLKRGLAAHLAVQATVAGAALLTLVDAVRGRPIHGDLTILSIALFLHLLFVVFEGKAAPKGRGKEFHRAAELITRGPYATRHWSLSVVAGIGLPMVMMLVGMPAVGLLAAVLTLVGLFVYEDNFVRAGQALPIS